MVYRGLFQCITSIYREEGIIRGFERYFCWAGLLVSMISCVGFFPGYTANLMRSVGGGLLLVIYDDLKHILGP